MPLHLTLTLTLTIVTLVTNPSNDYLLERILILSRSWIISRTVYVLEQADICSEVVESTQSESKSI